MKYRPTCAKCGRTFEPDTDHVVVRGEIKRMRDRDEERFPWFAQRIREYEEAAEAVDGEDWKDVLGWDGLYAVERDAKQAGQEQAKLQTCAGGCSRRKDPQIIAAFRARLDGATVGEAIDVLRGRRAPPEETEVVA